MTDLAAKLAAEAARVNFLRDEGQALRVRWDKGMNYFLSFYAELERLRPQIGDELLNDWCFWNMGIHLKTITATAKILEDEDARRVRSEMKVASDLAKAKAAQERAAAAAEKDAQLRAEAEARQQREAEIASKRAVEEAEAQRLRDLAKTKFRPKRSKITDEIVNAIKERFIKREPLNMREIMERFNIGDKAYKMAVERARGALLAEQSANGGYVPDEPPPPRKRGRPRRRDSRDTLASMGSQPATAGSDAVVADDTGSDLAAGIHRDLARIQRGREQADAGRQEWIEGSLGLADKLRQAKEKYPRNITFSAWLNDNGLGDDVLKPHDRTALIHMGRHLSEAREAMQQGNSWSWQVIWNTDLGYLANVSKTLNDAEPPAHAIIH